MDALMQLYHENTGKVRARAMQPYMNSNGSWNTLNKIHEVYPMLC